MYSNHLLCRGIYMPAGRAGLLEILRSCFEKFSEGDTNPLGRFNKARHESHEDGTLRSLEKIFSITQQKCRNTSCTCRLISSYIQTPAKTRNANRWRPLQRVRHQFNTIEPLRLAHQGSTPGMYPIAHCATICSCFSMSNLWLCSWRGYIGDKGAISISWRESQHL